MEAGQTADLKALLEDVGEAAKIIIQHANAGNLIHVASHIDADGIAAAGVIGKCLLRLDAYFHVRILKQIDENLLKELAEEAAPLYIFTDLGSGYLDLIKDSFSNSDVVILDHHQPVGEPFPKLTQVNPHLRGFNGANEISGTGVAYLTAKNIGEENIDLAPLAVVGALGDLQDKNKKRELHGLNEIIVKDAASSEHLKIESDLIFYGRETRPVHLALSHTTNPFIPGLSGEEDKCLGFLINLGINLKKNEKWRTLTDLSTDEKQKIFSELTAYLISKGLSSDVAVSLIGAVYTLTNEDRWTPLRDAREYSSLLNACGRMDKGGLGVSICMGSRGKTIEEAQGILADYRKTLAQYMELLAGTPGKIQEMEAIYVVRGEGVIDEKMLGSVSSILITTGLFKSEKPVIAFTVGDDGEIKVSARATQTLVSQGINLGSIMQKIAEKFSGRGGGHDIAAGAQVPKGLEDEFLKEVNSVIKEQIGRPLNES